MKAYPNAPEGAEARGGVAFSTVRAWLHRLCSLDGALAMQAYTMCSEQQQDELRLLLHQKTENPLPKILGDAVRSGIGKAQSPKKLKPAESLMTVPQIIDLLVVVFDNL